MRHYKNRILDGLLVAAKTTGDEVQKDPISFKRSVSSLTSDALSGLQFRPEAINRYLQLVSGRPSQKQQAIIRAMNASFDEFVTADEVSRSVANRRLDSDGSTYRLPTLDGCIPTFLMLGILQHTTNSEYYRKGSPYYMQNIFFVDKPRLRKYFSGIDGFADAYHAIQPRTIIKHDGNGGKTRAAIKILKEQLGVSRKKELMEKLRQDPSPLENLSRIDFALAKVKIAQNSIPKIKGRIRRMVQED
ncbi:MAG: hypothetical protein KGH98_02675 [Candidatus Micrarchaeota archaeon]|nr:hypothetical protein [Candidatus Micrarchaeota archaeon]